MKTPEEIADEVMDKIFFGQVNPEWVKDREIIIQALREYGAQCLERAADWHNDINPASDKERLDNIPGCGAFAAILDYRDCLRAEAEKLRKL
jgi:hypothetical protein